MKSAQPERDDVEGIVGAERLNVVVVIAERRIDNVVAGVEADEDDLIEIDVQEVTQPSDAVELL